MDKKLVFALIASMFIIIAYPQYLKMISKPIQDEQALVSADQSVAQSQAVSNEANDTNEDAEIVAIKEETYSIENDKLKVLLTNYGASIKNIELKKYSDENGENVFLYKGNDLEVPDSSFSYSAGLRIAEGSAAIDNKFNTVLFKVEYEEDSQQISFISPSINGVVVEKRFLLREESHLIDMEVVMRNITDSEKTIHNEISSNLSFYEEGKYDKQFVLSTIKSLDKFTTAKLGKFIKHGFYFENVINYASLENKYFTFITKPEYETKGVRINSLNNNTIRSCVESHEYVVLPQSAISQKVIFYAGPKEYNTLRAYKNDFESIVGRGFWGSLKIWFLIALNFFYKIFHNYGIAIILITIIIKIIFAPLTHKSFASMKKMQELQPQMKLLQEQYKEDPQRLNKEVMELYKKHKANPLSGCLPMLLQIPIFIVLYRTLSTSIELRGAHFLWWINDLSQPDSMFQFPFTLPVLGDSFNLLPILMLISMVVQQKMTPTTAASKEQEKMMLLMPVVFGFMFYGMPSGLVLYWFVNNVITILHQALHRKTAS